MQFDQKQDHIVFQSAPVAALPKLDAQAIAAFLLNFVTSGSAADVQAMPTAEYLVAANLARTLNGGVVYNFSLSNLAAMSHDTIVQADHVNITITGQQFDCSFI